MTDDKELCQKCGKPKDECECEEVSNPPAKADRTIVIKHTFEKGKGFVNDETDDPVTPPKPKNKPTDDDVNTGDNDSVDSVDELKKQLKDIKKQKDDYEQIVKLQAEEAFKNEKAAVVAQFPEDKRQYWTDVIGDDPDILEDVKRILDLKNAFAPPTPPANDNDGEGDGEGEGDGDGDKPKTEEEKFQDELEEFLNLAQDDEKREEMRTMIGNDKEKLANAKIWSNIIKSAVEQGGGTITGVPQRRKGKASLPQGNEGSVDNYKDYIDELYAIKRDPSRSPKEKQEADHMLDELFMQVIKGINVSRRTHGGAGLASYQINECPSCGALNSMPRGQIFDKCLACGWELYTKDARRG